MTAFYVMIIKFLLFIIVGVISLSIAWALIGTKRKEDVSPKENAPAVSIGEVRMERSEIMNRFYDYQMNDFLHRLYPNLRAWNPVHEERVGFHWEGLHVVTIHLLNGDRFNVSVYVQPDHLTPELYKEPQEQERKVSCEDIVSAWFAQWNSELATHATRGTGFAIPDDAFPQEEGAIDMIIENIVTQGDFSIMHDDEEGCFRLAYGMAMY